MASNSSEPPKAPGRKDWSQDVARAIGRKGGHAKAAKRKLMDSLGLLALESESTFAPYRDAAEAYRGELQRQFTARFGSVDAAASTMLASAALQLAASRWCFVAATGRVAFGETITEEGPVQLFVQGDPAIHAKASKLALDAQASLEAAWAWCERLETSKPAGAVTGAPSLEAMLT